MGKKRSLKLIPNETARRTTFRKRKAGLLKKAKELSTLCDVKVCSLICSPIEEQPSISPSPSEALQAFRRVLKLPPRKQKKYVLNPETFMQESVEKVKKTLEKEKEKNKRLEIEQAIAEYVPLKKDEVGSEFMDLEGMWSYIDEKLKKVNEKITSAQALSD